jgi:hypothetical protein
MLDNINESQTSLPAKGESSDIINNKISNTVESNNFISDGNNLDGSKLFNSIIEYLKPILSPIKV